MHKTLDIVAIVGSLRRDSFTRRLVRSFDGLLPATVRIEIVGIGELPFYNQDMGSSPPMAWREFRERIKRADAVLFATPEYNRSVSGVLKNAIDVGSRPYGSSVWAGMPAAIVSTSPGAMGGFGANHHLRQALVCLDMPTMHQPEAYIGGADKLVDSDGQFLNPITQDFFVVFLQTFESWIRRQIAEI
jgi:chromate reductase, NAD(P)H dehydrogenase (quinone)